VILDDSKKKSKKNAAKIWMIEKMFLSLQRKRFKEIMNLRLVG
jgi:hypothetical protein